jgi:SAM-dependent methyltransferase
MGIARGVAAQAAVYRGCVVTQSSRDDASYRHREIAGSFGADAAKYDRLRPRYPEPLVDAVAERLPGRSLLDVGIGTGISSQPFFERGFTVLGVEPDERMASLARSKGLAVETGRFEDWDPAGRVFDGVIAGQSWHWIDPDAGARRAAETLRPGGVLAIFWNFGAPPRQLAARFAEVFDSLDTGLPFNPWSASARPDRFENPYGSIIDRAAAGLAATGAFGEADRHSWTSASTVARDEWLESTSTSGGINRLPKDTLDALLDGLGEVIDDAGGSLEVTSGTVAAITTRV